MLTIHEALSPSGVIARRLPNYEHRQEQFEMSCAVETALREETHLVVEAGTGVGKSFAYLVPAILYAVEEQLRDEHRRAEHHGGSLDGGSLDGGSDGGSGGRLDGAGGEEEIDAVNADLDKIAELEKTRKKGLRRIVVSTHTISLQEQLINKDIPFLNAILPYEFSAVLVKGRSNYVCLRRLENAAKRTMSIFADDEADELVRINLWAKKTSDGSLSDLAPQPKMDVWDDVNCEMGNCFGKQCKFEKQCFYQQARRRIANSQIIIVNHAILFSDLAVRRQGGCILPVYDALVFDEAHTMEQAAADHLGVTVTQGQVDYLLNKLYNEHNGRGALAQATHVPSQEAVAECQSRAADLFESISDWLAQRPNSNGRVHEPGIVNNPLTEGLRKLSARLRDCIDKVPSQDLKQELTAARNKIITLGTTIDLWLHQSDDSLVYWIEKTTSQRGRTRIMLEAAPVHVGPILREHLFNAVTSVIMTSATLSTGRYLASLPQSFKTANKIADKAAKISALNGTANPFLFFKSRIGLTDVPTEQIGSPFDYCKQATLVLVKGMLPPDAPERELSRQLNRMLQRYLTETDGHAFVLFTSYSQLKKAAASILPWLAEQNMPLLTQGDGLPRSQMVAQFREKKRSVLFGTDSFWQGVDVPGDALQNVIITKLPFLVPGQPLIEAKLEAIEESGGNPFNDFQLPSAILKFKQGFGRLIRTKTDHGIIVVLDPRIHTKNYGRRFLDSLPECRMRIDTV
ncbi:MAG: helicase [Planctomycetaceae bacterium]|nr:helicase [Planctomycetaceae bacterium]